MIFVLLNYQLFGYLLYLKVICILVNDVICYGIFGEKVFKNGDVLNIDIIVIKNGYFGDISWMFIVGEGLIFVKCFVQIIYECMWFGIDQVKFGVYFGDIGYVIQKYVEVQGYSVVCEYCGYGIGMVFYEDLQVVYYGCLGIGIELKVGMIFMIELMINVGKCDICMMFDQWMVKICDCSLFVQWEYMVFVIEIGYEVLIVFVGMLVCLVFVQLVVVV